MFESIEVIFLEFKLLIMQTGYTHTHINTGRDISDDYRQYIQRRFTLKNLTLKMMVNVNQPL